MGLSLCGIPVQEFFLSFLAKRYGTQAAVMEMVYNVMHSLKGLQTETVYEIFYRILTGDYHESVHRSLYKSIAGLRHALVQLDKATMTRHRKHGVVKLRLVTDLINRIFGTKSDAEVIRIRYAISRDMKTMHAMRNQVRDLWRGGPVSGGFDVLSAPLYPLPSTTAVVEGTLRIFSVLGKISCRGRRLRQWRGRHGGRRIIWEKPDNCPTLTY